MQGLVFSQKKIKQAICLTGRSGCGKSTIISFFRNKYGDHYEIVEMTDNYLNFRSHLNYRFKNDIEGELIRLTQEKKVVFVLDQFERFFYLDEEKKKDIKQLIFNISKENTAIIISLREDYLADFLKVFNVNNLKETGLKKNAENDSGILSSLTNIVKISNKNRYRPMTNNPRKSHGAFSKRGIKKNYFLNLEEVGKWTDEGVLERVDNTIFYCEGQSVDTGGKNAENDEKIMIKGKCEELFGQKGVEFYEKHRSDTLIQQEIVFHMAEFEKKINILSSYDISELCKLENYELMNQYYDTQLMSTGDFFNASRIMYLLSSARINKVVMRNDDLEFGIVPEQFEKKGNIIFHKTLDKLEQLQLIRRNIKDSDLEYEVAHDFIANTFLSYSYTHIDRNVRGALDLFMSECIDTDKERGMKEKKDFFGVLKKSLFYKKAVVISAVSAVIAFLMIVFVYNPWLDVWKDYNVYGNTFSWFPLLCTEACMLYLYNIYNKVLRFCRGKKEKECKITYIICLTGCVVGVYFYPHGVVFLGVFLSIMGLTAAFLLNSAYQRASRNELRSYGFKCLTVGIAVIVFHFMMWAYNSTLPVYVVFIEMAMMVIIIGYGFLAHMTKEYLYGRIMDASSERVFEKD